MTFTMKEEYNNMLPFINVLVEKGPYSLINSVYWKLNFIGLCISLDSIAPKSTKMNLVKGLTQWALIICSNCMINAEI